jgi:hypothetical protein
MRYQNECRKGHPRHHSEVSRIGPNVSPGMKNAGDSNNSVCPTVRSRAEPVCLQFTAHNRHWN